MALEIRGAQIDYDGKPVLTDLDLAVADAEIVALLGPSGSGKSSLLRCIAGVQDLDGGRISWNGRVLDGTPAHERGFGLVFQDPLLFPHRSVGANVGFGMRPRQAGRIDELLTLVGLAGYEARDPSTLSGGEAQRVALARALGAQPRMLLLDEPFGALDAPLRARLVREVRALLKAGGIPAVHVTHDPDEAHDIADRVVDLAEISA